MYFNLNLALAIHLHLRHKMRQKSNEYLDILIVNWFGKI